MAHIHTMTTVCRDGWHNAFTDLLHWQGIYWVGYRKGSEHASIDGKAMIAISTDRKRFRELPFVGPEGDNRDPKFFAVSPNRLALVIPSWIGSCHYRDENGEPNLRQYITFSNDGFSWETPQVILNRNEWLWRIREHEGTYYALVNHIGKRGLYLHTSTDLAEWTCHARVGADDIVLNESDIFWNDNGEAWIVARSHGGTSFFATAQAPYTDWTTQDLGVIIHAPIFLHHENELYVAGRNFPAHEGDTTVAFPESASMAMWKVTRGSVERILQFPALGDCSYPGLIKDPDGRICITWYSQHAYHSAGVTGPMASGIDYRDAVMDDIYFAELVLP